MPQTLQGKEGVGVFFSWSILVALITIFSLPRANMLLAAFENSVSGLLYKVALEQMRRKSWAIASKLVYNCCFSL
jgi:hypothetical protein